MPHTHSSSQSNSLAKNDPACQQMNQRCCKSVLLAAVLFAPAPVLAEHGVVLTRLRLTSGSAGQVLARLETPAFLTVADYTVRDAHGQALLWFDRLWQSPGPTLKASLSARHLATLAIATKPIPATSPNPLANSGFDRQQARCAAAWESLLARGMKVEVPEPLVNDAWRSLVIGTFALADGDRMNYSAGNAYQRLYEAECGDAARALLLWGFTEDTRRMLAPLLEYQQQGVGFHDAGFKLQLLAHYEIRRCVEEREFILSQALKGGARFHHVHHAVVTEKIDQTGPLAEDRRGDEQLGRTVNHPPALAIVRVIAGHTLVAAEHHLRAGGDVADERRAVAAGVVLARRLPQNLAVGAAERDKVGIAVVVAVDDDLVLVKQRRTAKAVQAAEGTGPHEPALLAFEVVRSDEHLLAVEERDIDQFAVGCRRAGGETIERVLPLQRCGEDSLLPEDVSTLAVEAQQHALQFVQRRGDRENVVAPDDRRGVARAGQGGLPDHVAGGAPVDGEVLFQAGAVEPGSSPLGPVFGADGSVECDEREAQKACSVGEQGHGLRHGETDDGTGRTIHVRLSRDDAMGKPILGAWLAVAADGLRVHGLGIVPPAHAAMGDEVKRWRKEGVRVVFLPAGDYVFEATVRVPGGLTLLGEGSRTLVRTKTKQTRLFRVDGDKVRFTRLKMHGADTTASQNNDTYGISAHGKRNVRVDHCELLGFSYATSFGSEATAQVDHCSIHHDLRDGLGYGVAIYSGAYVLVSDNEFSQNRHSLASNGALDWSSGQRLGKFVHQSGVRRSHWEFIHNRVGSNDQSPNELCAVDTHPGMDGTFVVESNLFENLRHAIGIRDGSGLIRGNVFRNLRGKPFRPFVAISISSGKHNGIPVEDAMPHNIDVRENTFVNAADQVFAEGVLQSESVRAATAVKYVVGQAENVTVEGKLVPETRNKRGPSQPGPRLQEMDRNDLLRRCETRTTT